MAGHIWGIEQKTNLGRILLRSQSRNQPQIARVDYNTRHNEKLTYAHQNTKNIALQPIYLPLDSDICIQTEQAQESNSRINGYYSYLSLRPFLQPSIENFQEKHLCSADIILQKLLVLKGVFIQLGMVTNQESN